MVGWIRRARAPALAADVLGLLAVLSMTPTVAAPRGAIAPAKCCASLTHPVIPDSNMTITRADNACAEAPPGAALRRPSAFASSYPPECV